MQSPPRHQRRFDRAQFPFSLYRLSDVEYSQLRDRSFPIQIENLFFIELELTRPSTPDDLNLPKALVALEHQFGESSSRLERRKQAFSFPLLLAIEKPDGTFYYLLRITDRRGGIDFDLFRIIDRLEYDDRNSTYSSKPITGELSQTEIEYIICYLWGFLKGLAQRINRLQSGIKPFFRHIDSSHVIYGYWDGKFVEEEIDDLNEYEQKVCDLNAKYGKPQKSAAEKVTEICQLIQSIERVETGN